MEMLQELIHNTNNLDMRKLAKSKIETKIGSESYPIYIYGTGDKTVFILNIMEELGLNTEGIIVSDGYKNVELFNGVNVYEWKDVIKNEVIFNVINGMISHPKIIDTISKNKLVNRVVECFYENVLMNKCVPKDFFMNHFEEINSFYNMVEDDLSRNSIYRFWKIVLEMRGYENNELVVDNQYFQNDIHTFTNDEIFIDCGAYTGDTIQEFIQHVDGNYNQIISFEPDEYNHSLLLENTKQYHDIISYKKGVYSEKATLQFSNQSNASSKVCLEDDYSIIVEVESIDSIAENLPVTFIKMDIEGSELDALKGAKNTIEKNKPKLAICIYHKLEDFITIPKYIKQLVPEYKFYVRCHEESLNELVLYARI